MVWLSEDGEKDVQRDKLHPDEPVIKKIFFKCVNFKCINVVLPEHSRSVFVAFVQPKFLTHKLLSVFDASKQIFSGSLTQPRRQP